MEILYLSTPTGRLRGILITVPIVLGIGSAKIATAATVPGQVAVSITTAILVAAMILLLPSDNAVLFQEWQPEDSASNLNFLVTRYYYDAGWFIVE